MPKKRVRSAETTGSKTMIQENRITPDAAVVASATT